ncbi:MAG: GAF domain-containing protein, partial [Anaerolineae bacterium]|nr:GAF domain-containing protein [Anaerolineae bacterium]
VAFRAAGQPTGRLTVGFLQQRIISDEDRQFVRLLADSTAYQIENDLLFKQTQDSLEETGILYQAIRAFANAYDREGIIQAIIDYAADPAVDKALLCLLLTPTWQNDNAMMEVAVSWVRGDSVMLTGMRFTAEQFPSWEQLSTDEILWVDDVLQDPTLDDTARMGYRALDIAAFTIIPLVVTGSPIGAIVLGSSEPRRHTEREVRIYQSLADQAAITLQNNQLTEGAERRARQLATSAEVSRAANSILRLDELLPKVVDLIKASFDYDHVQIFLVDDANERAVLRASTGEVGQQLLRIRHNLAIGSMSVIGQVTENAVPSIALDTADARVVHKPNPYLPNTRSEMAVPLISRGRVVGALDVQSNQPGAFTQDDVQILTVLADQLAVAIENASLFEESEANLAETSILYQTIAALSEVDSQEEVVEALVSHAIPSDIDKVMLCLLLTPRWDSRNAMMEVAYSWVRGDSVNLTGMRFTAEQFPSWEQLSTPDVLAIDDVMSALDLEETARLGYRALDISSFAILPLAVASGPLGAIILGASSPRRHTEREVRIYRSLADQAATQLQNSLLYAQAEHRARQLATSARVSQAANSILHLDELLPEITDYIKEAFKYDHVQVFLIEGDDAMLRASTGEAGKQLLAIQHSLPIGSASVIGQVTQHGKPHIALDTADARVVHKPNPYLPNTRSEMAVPLIAKGQVVGALDVQSNQPGAFTEDDVQILTVLADQLAVAIENARLFADAEQRSREMSFLFSVTAEATAADDLSASLQRTSQRLLAQFEADLVVPYLLNRSTNMLEARALAAQSANLGLANLRPIPLQAADAIASAGRTTAPVMLTDVLATRDYQERVPGMRSSIYIPLTASDELIGVLTLESRRYSHFTANSLNVLQTLSGSLAAVIQNTRLVDDLQQANERLREIDKLKTNFLSAMSHELRTPLNSIIGFSRVILKGIDGPITDMQRQDLQTIHDSGKHLLGLVNDILDQAKIEAGKMELKREYFDLKGVLKGVMDSAKGLTKDKPIRLHLEVPEDLPEAYGDEFRTRQVLFNLVSNASKFTQQGSVTTSARMVMRGETPMIQVSVTDTGKGIRPEEFDQIFEAFQQADNSSTREVEGTGLGLPISKRLVELQGGEIWVESEYGRGSTFSITIPTVPPPQAEEAPAAETETVAASANGHNAPESAPPMLIMVADADMDIINLYRRYLSASRLDVVGVSHLEEVEKQLGSHQFQAVILDVNMEGGAGWQTLEQIAGRIPVIVASLDTDVARSVELGAAQHIVKPFMPEDLVRVVQETLTLNSTPYS